MIEDTEKDQLENICSSLLKGFIEWIDKCVFTGIFWGLFSFKKGEN